MAVTPHRAASEAAVEVLRTGGNAVDAAVCANAVLGVVAPETCGVGGDLFALVHHPGAEAPAVLNASGRAGSAMDAAALRADGHAAVPSYHPATVTVPGCVDGWTALTDRFGSRPLGELLRPALEAATGGFAVSAELADALAARGEELAPTPSGPDLYPGGRPPLAGDTLRRPRLAATLEAIAADGRTGFYGGEAGTAMTAVTPLTRQDLAVDQADWVEPLGTELFGLSAWTVPPNSQGYLTLAAAWLVEHLGVPADFEDPRYSHLLVEAYRAVAWERDELVADARFAAADPASLLDPDRLRDRLRRIDRDRPVRWPDPIEARGGTAYLCVIDGDGVAVSLIQSNFWGLGSGVAAGDSGVFLHNRGAGFTLQPGHPNELAPGKRPLHTLSPTLWTRGGQPALLLGTRGGRFQPQLLLQIIGHLFVLGLDPAAAQRLPRWVLDEFGPGTVSAPTVESRFPPGLQRLGHEISTTVEFDRAYGPVSLIAVDEAGRRTAAADPRVPTAAAAAV